MKAGDYEHRQRTHPPRVNREYFAPHMPQHPQVLVWREVNGVDRFEPISNGDETETKR